jgi:hypothetical protein
MGRPSPPIVRFPYYLWGGFAMNRIMKVSVSAAAMMMVALGVASCGEPAGGPSPSASASAVASASEASAPTSADPSVPPSQAPTSADPTEPAETTAADPTAAEAPADQGQTEANEPAQEVPAEPPAGDPDPTEEAAPAEEIPVGGAGQQTATVDGQAVSMTLPDGWQVASVGGGKIVTVRKGTESTISIQKATGTAADAAATVAKRNNGAVTDATLNGQAYKAVQYTSSGGAATWQWFIDVNGSAFTIVTLSDPNSGEINAILNSLSWG